jgi:hypothetical protein
MREFGPIVSTRYTVLLVLEQDVGKSEESRSIGHLHCVQGLIVYIMGLCDSKCRLVVYNTRMNPCI